jgi:hypothetical protein
MKFTMYDWYIHNGPLDILTNKRYRHKGNTNKIQALMTKVIPFELLPHRKNNVLAFPTVNSKVSDSFHIKRYVLRSGRQSISC